MRADCTSAAAAAPGGLRRTIIALAALALAVGIGACGRERLPEVEALIVTGDSTFWVTSDRGIVQARGVPMLVARVDGRFTELYVADDDRSFYNAVFVGHRLFSRDLVRGDSVELHRDTVVSRLAADYATAHPGEHPLEPDEPENDAAAIRATSDLEIRGVTGPYVSYEHLTDVDAQDDSLAEHRHTDRRGVLDARTGAAETIASLFGTAVADTMIPRAQAAWLGMRDTVLAVAERTRRQRATRALADFAFDPASFSIGSSGANPLVTFAVPVSGENADLDPVELPSRDAVPPVWWAAAAAELSITPGEGGTWVRHDDTVHVRVERGTQTWTIALRHGAGTEHSVVRVSSAVERVMWLGRDVSPDARSALVRAFAEAGEYDGDRRIAALDRARAPMHLAAHERRPPTPGTRVRPRDVRADDAAGREHGGARVRWGHSGDARQDGRRVRDAARPQAVRHGIG